MFRRRHIVFGELHRCYTSKCTHSITIGIRCIQCNNEMENRGNTSTTINALGNQFHFVYYTWTYVRYSITMGERLKIATYNVRTLLKDEHVQELTERRTERKQHEMGRDRDRRSPKKRGTFHNSPKWPPAVQWASRCRLPRKQEMERQHNKSILWEFQSSRTSPTYNRQLATEDRSSICPNDISLRWRDWPHLQHHW